MSGVGFDLRTEPWIPARTHDGSVESVGLAEILTRAHEFASLAVAIPLDAVAVYRLLIVLAHRILGDPVSVADWVDLMQLERFGEHAVHDYFARYSDRFELFHEKYPFMQTAGLEQIDKDGRPDPSLVAVLLSELATGNNKTLFDHTVEDVPPALHPRDATYAVIRAQLFSLGGIAKKNSTTIPYQPTFYQAPLVAGIPVLVTGHNLFETIVANVVPRKKRRGRTTNPLGREDLPNWERGIDERYGELVPDGYLDYMTIKARHLRLVPEVSNGTVRVSRVHLTQGVKPIVEPLQEPFFYWKTSRRGDHYAPQLDPERVVWRDCSAILTVRPGNDSATVPPSAVKTAGDALDLTDSNDTVERSNVEVFAFANDKANPILWRHERLSFPRSILSNPGLVRRLEDALEAAEQGATALINSTRAYFEALLDPHYGEQGHSAGKQMRDTVSERASGTGVLHAYWSKLDEPFRHFLSEVDDEDSVLRFERRVERAATEALQGLVLRHNMGSPRVYQAQAVAGRVLSGRLRRILRSKYSYTHEEVS